MNRFFQSVGILATCAALVYGAKHLFDNYKEITATFFQVLGVVAFTGLILFSILRLIYGNGWFTKGSIHFYFGKGLKESTLEIIQGYRRGKIGDDALAGFITHLVWRITRIGIFGLIIAVLPTWFLWQQNILFSEQNTKIDNQIRLDSAQYLQAQQQTKLLSEQTSLFKNQNEKLDTQNLLFGEQNRNVATQTELFEDQNRLVQSQNARLDSQIHISYRQNDLFKDQNELVLFQNMRIDSQITLLKFQNSLIGIQNDRLNFQNNLMEAERRGSSVIFMGNILANINNELQEKKASDSRNLSKETIGDIVSLSQALKPYRYLSNDTLVNYISPERGQLLINILNHRLSSNSLAEIFQKSNFDYSELIGINFFYLAIERDSTYSIVYTSNNEIPFAKGQYPCPPFCQMEDFNDSISVVDTTIKILRRLNLRSIQLNYANLEEANLFGFDVTHGKLRRANLVRSILIKTDFTYADLSYTNLEDADFSNAILHNCDLRFADFKNVNLRNANMAGAQLLNSRNLKFDQLKSTSSLFNTRNIEPSIEKLLRVEKPCLFTEGGCK